MKLKQVLVFDLDDTLYPEITFVISGFKSVATFLNASYGVDEKAALALMIEELKKGRGKIFDDLLKAFSIFSKILVKKCLSIYRSHKPNISLYPDAARCLKRFKDTPLYIVTDGNKLVQHNKQQLLLKN